MRRTDNLRVQHRELKSLLSEVNLQLKARAFPENSSAVIEKLNRISGILMVHLSMEDKHLYPKLLRSTDPSVQTMAQVFIDEMGQISDAFSDYVDQWLRPDAIEKDTPGFMEATLALSSALVERIDREDRVLYPQVDNLKEL